MGQRLSVHPVTPQGRFLDRAGEVVRDGGVIIVPTDSTYALAALPGSRTALERIARLKGFDGDSKLYSLIAPGLAEVATYARVDNAAYRILRRHLPGPYTFVLPATNQAPRILGERRKTIGLRVPDHLVAIGVAERAGGILFATTLKLPGDERPLADPDEIEARVGKLVDLFLDQGNGGIESSTMIDLCGAEPVILREGVGDPEPFR